MVVSQTQIITPRRSLFSYFFGSQCKMQTTDSEWKLNVFLHKYVEVLDWIALDASVNEPCGILFCQCQVNCLKLPLNIIMEMVTFKGSIVCSLHFTLSLHFNTDCLFGIAIQFNHLNKTKEGTTPFSRAITSIFGKVKIITSKKGGGSRHGMFVSHLLQGK